ncbi:phenylacetate--CoA ligase [Methanospirillum sp. J.3.6.1-F.2.7.3]|jgi:phenylacetate-CoA ligase|uniref:Phenylacetate--CoA ligase n=1 Tax=Methanospirillum purgamenti TaxID=2834276 RepID=A0A8E7B419_9EURY|nr:MULTISPECIES: phenylacetate--CoA ligase [Methanospirillum]MDX8549978.1 phenylacetate--CoA ligase [Methanospirillum hungatei]NLW75505.1 phenylacetate--CoA ligase [Methanomicrobiales archaeon]QVV90107.1 phenylacetate--CoA ligase [Methanospirillum sp. J.3.6.1-F.2.7.3]
MRCWDPRIEEMPVSDLQKLQYKLLKTLVYRVYSFSPFYHRRMKEAGVHPDDINSLADITKLPFMYKKDLRDTYPDGMIMSEQEELVRYHVSSGTTGKPTVVGYTKNDIYNWTESLARALTSAGLGRGDVMQVSYGYGLFTGGLGLHYGAERIGATVLPTSVGNTERQIELMQDLKVTAIACTPSYLLHMGEVAEKMGISIKNDTLLRKAVVGAEPWSEQMRIRIKDSLGVDAYDIYGTSELSGPLFCECEYQQGFHVWGDLIYPEILDPDSQEPLPPGERGELVVTMLQKDGLPIIRYRTGDVTAIREEPCPCGRTHPRLERLSGRVDDMLIIRGINVFPSQIEHALLGIPEVAEHFMIEVDRIGALDEMLIKVELAKEAFSDKISDLMRTRRHVEKILKSALNVQVSVELTEPGTLPRFEGKAKRVIDKRLI